MNLKQYIRHLLYDNTTYESPDIYQRFRIVCPEYSQHDIEVKPIPSGIRAHVWPDLGYPRTSHCFCHDHPLRYRLYLRETV